MLWENWCLPTTLQFHFWDLGNLYLRPLFDHGSWQLFQSCKSWAEAVGVDLNGWNNQNSLENPIVGSLLCRLQTVAPVGLARIGWLLRQAKPSLRGSSGRTGSKCHWAWNVKSTIRIPELPLHNTNLDCNEKAGAYLQLYSFIFVLCKLFT